MSNKFVNVQRSIIAVLVAGVTLSACGYRGPVFLPTPQQQRDMDARDARIEARRNAPPMQQANRPAPQRPGMQQRGPQQPGMQQRGPQQSGIQQRGSQRPGMQQRGVQQKAPQKAPTKNTNNRTSPNGNCEFGKC